MQNMEAGKPTIESIAERINNAVMEHRLAPGSKLSETRMAAAFNVSRTKIRQVLAVLAKKGLVEVYPNRGAFIASPTVQEAHELFATRRLLEPEIIRNVIARAQKADLKRLHEHLDKEKMARQQKNRRAIIRLSGDFHLLLARISGNRYVESMMGELCPLTCLIIAMYDLPQTPACPEDEHDRIVAAIERRDEKVAIELMLHHLQHIESALHLTSNHRDDVDWDQILG